MMRFKFAGLMTFLAIALGGNAAPVPAASEPAAERSIVGVRFGDASGETRIVIDLDRPTSGRVLKGDQARQIRLALADVGTNPLGLKGIGRGVVAGWSIRTHGNGVMMQLDLLAEAQVIRRFLLPPADGVGTYRYVIDLRSNEGLQPSLAQGPVRRLDRSERKVIVIDAGHGGKDPGAAGSVGREKDVTLAAALALKSRLQATGRYRVVLTRDSDDFIPLEGRVQIARRAEADLFISLHADSGPDTSTRGASVYTLSEAGATRVARVLDRNEWFMNASLTARDRSVS